MVRRTLALSLLTLSFMGCGDDAADRYREALAAADRGDLQAYSLYFTQDSAQVIRGSQEVRAREGRDLSYFDDVFQVLPRGQVLGSDVEGDIARVRVQGKRHEVAVRMRQERGLWVIDGFALASFWAPLKEAVD